MAAILQARMQLPEEAPARAKATFWRAGPAAYESLLHDRHGDCARGKKRERAYRPPATTAVIIRRHGAAPTDAAAQPSWIAVRWLRSDGSYNNMLADIPDAAPTTAGASLSWLTRRIAVRARFGSPALARLLPRSSEVVTT
jgi:hypothetical protein